MEAIRLNEYVTEKGLNIVNKDLMRFKNMKVEVIILPLEEKREEKNFMNFAGILSENEGNEMLENLEECRKIDKESW